MIRIILIEVMSRGGSSSGIASDYGSGVRARTFTGNWPQRGKEKVPKMDVEVYCQGRSRLKTAQNGLENLI